MSSVTVFEALAVPTAWFPKDSVAGERAAWVIPVPVRDTVWGLLLALSVIVRVPVRVPRVLGVNVTLTLHFAPAARDVPQVFVWVKSPDAAIEEIVSTTLCPFFSVTVFALLAVEIA